MALTLNTIKKNIGARKRTKRVGRGNASGHGTYATRGLKGQKSRSGSSGLVRIGMKQVIRSTPKLRGFKSLRAKAQTVSFGVLSASFKDGALISPSVLFKAGVVNSASVKIKILNSGKLTLKNLRIENVDVSSGARAAIEAAGGKIK
jgi:large subunit ribosomal protein L15